MGHHGQTVFCKKTAKNNGELRFVVKKPVIWTKKRGRGARFGRKQGKLPFSVTHILLLLAKNERLAYNETVYTCTACRTPFV